MTDDGYRPITIAHLEYFVLRRADKNRKGAFFLFFFFLIKTLERTTIELSLYITAL